jgi:hypothetical protein
VDGTKNNIGNVSAAAYLDVTHNNKKGRHTFYIIDLGEDHMLLGMPFLADTNPEIDWTLGQLQGKVKAATTDAHRWEPHRHSKVHKPFNFDNNGTCYYYQPHNTPPPNGEYEFINIGPEDYDPNSFSIIRRLTKSTDLAAETVITITRPWRTLVPKEYHRFGKVFSEHAANRFPGKRPWDHTIELIPDAPPILNCKVYPLAHRQQQLLDDFLKEHLKKGYIRRSGSPYMSSFFFVKKKDGKQ